MAEEQIPFEKKQVTLAVKAILAFVKKEQKKEPTKKKTDLFEAKQGLFLTVGFQKIPATQVKPTLIPLPHPHHDVGGEVCFISSKPGKEMRKLFEEKGVTNISKVISLTKLRKEYKSYTLKRQLIAAYDVFLCEEKIYHFVCKTLGKECYKHKKEPIPVRTRYADLKKEVEKCLSSTLFRIGHGPNSTLIIGNLKQQKEKEFTENLLHAMRIVGKKLPGNWKNVQGMYLKTATSVALPLYQALPVAMEELKDVKIDEVQKKKRKRKPKEKPTLKNVNPEEMEEEKKGVEGEKDENEDIPLAEKENKSPLDEIQNDETIEDEPIKKKKKSPKVTSSPSSLNEKKTDSIKKSKKLPSKKSAPKKVKQK